MPFQQHDNCRICNHQALHSLWIHWSNLKVKFHSFFLFQVWLALEQFNDLQWQYHCSLFQDCSTTHKWLMDKHWSNVWFYQFSQLVFHNLDNFLKSSLCCISNGTHKSNNFCFLSQWKRFKTDWLNSVWRIFITKLQSLILPPTK